MRIGDIYANYKTMPSLQLHQLRVAGVANMITDNFIGPLDKKSLLIACLLHDIGKIVMFDFKAMPQAVEPEGFDYWEKVQSEMIDRYGDNQHVATNKMVEELGCSDKIRSLIKMAGFGNATTSEASKMYEIKILTYSDMRVAPFGVTSLEDRLEDGRKRFIERNGESSSLEFDRESLEIREIEKQVFAKCSISPLEINDTSVGGLIDSLRNFEVI